MAKKKSPPRKKKKGGRTARNKPPKPTPKAVREAGRVDLDPIEEACIQAGMNKNELKHAQREVITAQRKVEQLTQICNSDAIAISKMKDAKAKGKLVKTEE